MDSNLPDPWHEWQPTSERQPNEGMCLAKGPTHDGVALARRNLDDGLWEVQPFKSSWYITFGGITHWMYAKTC